MAYRRKQGGAVAADERRSSYPQDSASSYSYTSFKSMDEPKLGLWGTLARKAKGMLDEDGLVHKFEDLRREPTRSNPVSSTGDQAPQPRWSFENHWKSGDAASRIRPEALSASVNQLGGRIRNAFEEGLTIVDHKTSSIIQETKKIQIRKKPASSTSSFMPNSAGDTLSTPNQTFDQTTTAAEGTRLKASRDVANAMAAKAKLLLRELKSVKADLAFAKQRCAQLEEENKLLREIKQKGSKTEEDDDLIRVQLETLLAEKSRLAQENSTYARENRFLREIVEFHQFTTHEVLSVDDGDIEDDNQEQDSNLICTENELPIVEEELSHVSLDSGKPSSPKFSNSHSVVDSPNNISEQLHHHLSDTA